MRRGRFWVTKYFSMDPAVLRRFEAACRLLGLYEYEVLNKLLAEWLEGHENQAQLSGFLVNAPAISLHVDRVNIVAAKVSLLLVKKDLQVGLRIRTRGVDQDTRDLGLEKIRKALHSA